MALRPGLAGAFVFVLLALGSPAAFAEDGLIRATETVVGTPGGFAYGTTSHSVVSVSDREFAPQLSTTPFTWAGGRYTTVSSSLMTAGLDIPTGALLEGIEMDACDASATGQVRLGLFYCPFGDLNGFCYGIADVGSGAVATPGCGILGASIFPTLVDNHANSYILTFQNTTNDGSTKWRNARVYYRRQVSPAPASATFADVPVGHSLHQFVEALAASGITAGCGGGNFCPNAAVTRGQMAVFLAKALGLHWAQ